MQAGAHLDTELITKTEAGRIAGRDARTIDRWVRTGDVPDLGVRVGGRILVRRSVLERLVYGDNAPSRPAA